MRKPKNINTQAQALRSGQFMSISMNHHKTPEFKEVTNVDWTYYGSDNNYPEYLLRCYNRSAKHNAIINQKAAYISGRGFEGDDVIVNEEGETFKDISKKICLDYVLFGGFAMEVIRSLDGGKIFLRHIDFSRIRSDKYNEKFFYSEQWSKCYGDDQDKYFPLNKETIKGGDYDYQEWDAFSLEGKGKQLFYFKSYRPNLDTYPLPDYVGALGYIEMDYQIMNYWYNAVKYGFTPSHMITFFNGAPMPEEQKKVEDAILAKFTTTDGRKLILNFAESKETGGSEVVKLEHEDLDKQFQILNKTVEQEIYAGHRVNNPMLMGIKTEGQLGGRNELIEANELFQNVYVTPIQNIVSHALIPITDLLGIDEIKFNNIEPIGYQFSEQIIREVLPVEAVREMIASRMGIDLTKYPESKIVNPDVKLKKEFNLLEYLKKIKVERKGKFLKSRALSHNDFKNVKLSEQKFIGENFATLKDNQLSVLDLLDKDNKMSPSDIADVLKIPVQKVNGIIAGLKEKKLLKEVGDLLKPTPNAIKILEDTEAPTANVFVVYSYEWRDGFSDKDEDSSRDFCIELMKESEQRKASNSLWTREDIEGMTNEMEDSFASDVWESRGGWYTLPGTDIHRPSCRHIWVQNIYTTE